MFEHRTQPLLPRALFLLRMGRSVALSLGIIGGSLAVGIAGFHLFNHMSPVDAALNAAMLLGGMGPVNMKETDPTIGKLFAAFYALYAGLVFLIVAGLLLAPVFHRILHHFHLESSSR